MIGQAHLLRLGALAAPQEAPLVVADVCRLWHELRWAPKHDLASGLAETIEWWRKALTPCPAAGGGKSRLESKHAA
jgi:nucleoside-diphosphate-sugar epimerase